MARIVKSISVVDDREQKAAMSAQLDLTGRKVLKNNVLAGFGFPLQNHNAPVTRDALLDEINRLKVKEEESLARLRDIDRQILEAQKEHERKIFEAGEEFNRLIREGKEELKRLETAKEDADIVDDEIYHQRIQEINALMESVQRQSDELLMKAEEDGAEIREHSRVEGYREGYADGYDAADKSFRSEAEQKLTELTELINSLSSYGEELMAQRESEFIQLAVAVAGKIVAKELKTKPATVLDMLRGVLIKNHREAYVNVSISPDILPAQAKACEEVLEKLRSAGPNITVYVEKDAEPGTLLLETPKGVTDMSLDTQLSNLQEALLEPEDS